MSKQMCVWVSIASNTGVHHPEVWRCDAVRRQMLRGPALTPVAPRPGWRRHCSQLSACRYPSQLLISFLLTAVMNGVAVSGTSSRGHWDFLDWWHFCCFTWLAAWNRCLHEWGDVKDKVNGRKIILHAPSWKKPSAAEGKCDFFFSLLFTPSSPHSS